MIDVTTREVMRFERIARDIDAGFDCGDAVIDNHSYRHFAQTHSEHFYESYRSVRHARSEPKSEESENENAENEREQRDDRDANKIKRFHGAEVSEGGSARKV